MNTPVPWVALWSAQEEALLADLNRYIKPLYIRDTEVWRRFEPEDLAGQGEPLPGRVASTRAIKSVTHVRCHICGLSCIEKPYWAIVAGTFDVEVDKHFAGRFLPMCEKDALEYPLPDNARLVIAAYDSVFQVICTPVQTDEDGNTTFGDEVSLTLEQAAETKWPVTQCIPIIRVMEIVK